MWMEEKVAQVHISIWMADCFQNCIQKISNNQPFRKWTDLLIDSISIRAIEPFRKCTDLLTDSYFENQEKLNSMKKIISTNFFIFDFYMVMVTIIALGSIEIVQTLITGSASKASLEKRNTRNKFNIQVNKPGQSNQVNQTRSIKPGQSNQVSQTIRSINQLSTIPISTYEFERKHKIRTRQCP